ncbi:DUF5906 domain-containing protein [Glutamicibacter sp. NPDC087583]|uniref:DUF5906 domain-containing protein n=1 Tax=Glutamicibacter sp. NPDC087583 TaxID=3363995 RepID=UPI0037FEF9B9
MSILPAAGDGHTVNGVYVDIPDFEDREDFPENVDYDDARHAEVIEIPLAVELAATGTDGAERAMRETASLMAKLEGMDDGSIQPDTPAPRKPRITAAAKASPVLAIAPEPVEHPEPIGNLWGTVPDSSVIPQAAASPLNDIGLGERLSIYYDGRLAWVVSNGSGHWKHFNGKFWEEDAEGVNVRHAVRVVIRTIAEEEVNFSSQLSPSVKRAEKALQTVTALGNEDLLPAAREAVQRAKDKAEMATEKFADTCSNGRSHIDAALDAAKNLMTINADRFDRDYDQINTPDGLLNLRTLAVEPHRPEQYVTRITAVGFKPGATHQDLESVLEHLDNNIPEFREFLRSFFGLGLTGYTVRTFMAICGAAGVGKSTVFEAFMRALGDINGSGYGKKLSKDAINTRVGDGASASPALHDLQGARFVFADEADRISGDASTLKILSSGGTIPTRTLYGKPVSWKSQATIVIASNNPVSLPDNDAGIADRLVAATLTVPVPKGKRDGTLDDRLKTERPQLEAIFAFGVEGAHAWLKRGGQRKDLGITREMELATAAFLKDSDPLEPFFEAQVEEEEEDSPAAGRMMLSVGQWHELYSAWASSHRIAFPIKHEELGQRLKERGLTTTGARMSKAGGFTQTKKQRLVEGIYPNQRQLWMLAGNPLSGINTVSS